jgi:hypothetical protein
LTTSIADVRQTIADACQSLAGIRAQPYVTDSVATPQATVSLNEVNYDLVFARGADIWNYTVTVYAQRSSERSAQILLDELREPVGPTSLKTVLEEDVALAALVDYVVLRRASPVQSTTVGAIEYLLVEFTVEVCY